MHKYTQGVVSVMRQHVVEHITAEQATPAYVRVLKEQLASANCTIAERDSTISNLNKVIAKKDDAISALQG